MDTSDLAGCVAVVTGASSGLGAHFTRVLADAGMYVVAAARRADRLAALGSPGRVMPYTCDVTDDHSVESLVERATHYGRLSVVVNNAGATDAVVDAHTEDMAVFRQVMAVNLDATFRVSACAARSMISTGDGGSIVNISSIHGLVAGAPNNQAAYVASKSAVIGLTRELAGQWASYGIRVNAIAPGYFPTELTGDMLAGEDAGLRYVKRGTMLARPGRLEELDGPLLLLASGAGAYITGHTLVVDGGWTAR